MRTLLVLSVIGLVAVTGWQAYLDSEKGSVPNLSRTDENLRSDIPDRPTSFLETTASQRSDKSSAIKQSKRATSAKTNKAVAKTQPYQARSKQTASSEVASHSLPQNVKDQLLKKGARGYEQLVKVEKQWVPATEGRITGMQAAKHQPCTGYSIFCERVRKGHEAQLVGLSIDSARVADRHQKVIQGEWNKGHYVDSTPALYLD